jgi:hypothetical protein
LVYSHRGHPARANISAERLPESRGHRDARLNHWHVDLYRVGVASRDRRRGSTCGPHTRPAGHNPSCAAPLRASDASTRTRYPALPSGTPSDLRSRQQPRARSRVPRELRSQRPTKKTIRARVTSLARLDTSEVTDPTVRLRLQLMEHRVAMQRDVLEQDRIAARELAETRSTLTSPVGIAPRAASGDHRRSQDLGTRA